MTHAPASPPRAGLRALARNRSGVAMLEFALSMPIFIALTMVGMETVNLAYATQKIGDIATLTTDQIGRACRERVFGYV